MDRIEWEDLAAGKVVTIAVWNSIIKISLFYSKEEAWEEKKSNWFIFRLLYILMFVGLHCENCGFLSVLTAVASVSPGCLSNQPSS